jgi:hypothetical protein
MYQYFIKVCPILWDLIKRSIKRYVVFLVKLLLFFSLVFYIFLYLLLHQWLNSKYLKLFFSLVFQVVPTVYTDINEHIILSNQVISFFLFSFCGQTAKHHAADAHIGINCDFKHSLRCCNSLPQFSVTEHFRSGEGGRMQALPGVFFFYDLSPIKVPSRCTLHLILYWR